jgi:cold shock CspA family protein
MVSSRDLQAHVNLEILAAEALCRLENGTRVWFAATQGAVRLIANWRDAAAYTVVIPHTLLAR